MSWKNEVEELSKRKKLALKLGGKEKVQRQHKAKRFTVRERIDYQNNVQTAKKSIKPVFDGYHLDEDTLLLLASSTYMRASF